MEKNDLGVLPSYKALVADVEPAIERGGVSLTWDHLQSED